MQVSAEQGPVLQGKRGENGHSKPFRIVMSGGHCPPSIDSPSTKQRNDLDDSTSAAKEAAKRPRRQVRVQAERRAPEARASREAVDDVAC